jgi:hypothetical protein
MGHPAARWALLMQLPRRPTHHCREKGDSRGFDLVERDDKCVFAGRSQRQVEDQHSGGIQIYHPGWRFVDLHHPGLLESEVAGGIEELDPKFVATKFGTAPAEMEHEMSPRVHGRELLYRNMAPDAQHGELAPLVQEGVIAEQREVDARTQLTRTVRTTSPCLMALTTSIPLVTWPNAVCTPSRCGWGP